jgi:putative transcriptional regulator
MEQSILDTVHETAQGLQRAGLMDKKTMQEFDSLCLFPVKTYTPEQIKQIRLKFNVSQTVFAMYLNASPATIRKWEQGQTMPKGPSLKLLNIVEQKGLEVLASG